MFVSFVARSLGVGVFATLAMDLGSALGRKIGFTAGIPPRLIGRWFAGFGHGRLVHHTILEAPPVRGEIPLALAGHYLIGITLALLFLSLAWALKASPSQSVVLALVFGAATNLLPWLLMFPAMGFGTFGASGPSAFALLRTSFFNHCFFASGLALAARWLTPSVGG